jgi:hypothetical protein
LLLRAGQSPLEPRLVTAPGGSANRKRATPIKLVGSREKSNPAKRLNRVWPDTGPTDKRLTAAKDRTFNTVRPNQEPPSGLFRSADGVLVNHQERPG